MKKFTVRSMGDTVQGVEIKGNPKNPEPETFRISFPGGDVDVVRTTDGEYWVHARVNNPDDGGSPDRVMGRLVDARLDIIGKHAADADRGDLDHSGLFHLAVRVGVHKEIR